MGGLKGTLKKEKNETCDHPMKEGEYKEKKKSLWGKGSSKLRRCRKGERKYPAPSSETKDQGAA